MAGQAQPKVPAAETSAQAREPHPDLQCIAQALQDPSVLALPTNQPTKEGAISSPLFPRR